MGLYPFQRSPNGNEVGTSSVGEERVTATGSSGRRSARIARRPYDRRGIGRKRGHIARPVDRVEPKKYEDEDLIGAPDDLILDEYLEDHGDDTLVPDFDLGENGVDGNPHLKPGFGFQFADGTSLDWGYYGNSRELMGQTGDFGKRDDYDWLDPWDWYLITEDSDWRSKWNKGNPRDPRSTPDVGCLGNEFKDWYNKKRNTSREFAMRPNDRAVKRSRHSLLASPALPATLGILLLLACTSARPQTLSQPLGEWREGAYLIIGCVILEVEGESIRDLVVSLGHYPIGTGPRDSLPGHVEAKVDSLGYFALPNLPPKEYVLGTVASPDEGLFLYRSVGAHLTREWVVDIRHLGGGGGADEWSPGSMPHDPIEPDNNGVVDLGIIVLKARHDDQEKHIDPWTRWDVKSSTLAELTAGFLVSKHGYRRVSPSEYFANMCPQSGWAPLLKQRSGGRRDWAP